MAIRQAATNTIPKDLPAAHLFLDDIEQLTHIFTEMTETMTAEGALLPDEGQVRYTVDESTVCDDIADLQKLGGKHRQFEIRVSGAGEITVSKYNSRCVISYMENSADRWKLYAKVLAIFQHRPRRIRMAFDYIPSWLSFVFFSSIWALLVALLALLKWHGSFTFWTIFVAYLVVVNSVTYCVTFRHSIVELRYAHEVTTFREKWKMVQPYVLIAVGALAYALAERFVKAIWP